METLVQNLQNRKVTSCHVMYLLIIQNGGSQLKEKKQQAEVGEPRRKMSVNVPGPARMMSSQPDNCAQVRKMR